MNEVGEEIGEGCLFALFDILPWQLSLTILVILIIIWLIAGHPGIG